MMNFITLLLATVVVTSSTILNEQLDIYRKVLQNVGHDGEDLTIDGFKTMLKLLDDDSMCDEKCEEYIRNWFGGDKIGWTPFNQLVDAIYGDQISEDPYQPQEVHLSLTNDKTSMKVMWVTGSLLQKPIVEYLPLSSNDWSKATIKPAKNFTYEVPQKWWPTFHGVIYEVDMTELESEGEYHYRVGGFDIRNRTTRTSADFKFKAPPASTNNADRTTRIGTLADHGTFMLLGFAVTDKMIAVQDELGLEMIMTVGDLCYAGLSSAVKVLNIDKEDEFEHVWDLWGIQNEPVAATRPYMVGPGNHERFYNYEAYINRLHMPSEMSNGNGSFWYAYDYGNSYWISLDSESSLEPDSPQYDWLVTTLENAVANRVNQPWIVVTIHRPIYCSSEGSPMYYSKLEPLLLQYDVDLTITGHMHLYERIHPSNNLNPTLLPEKGKTTEDLHQDVYHSTGYGPVHVVQGNSGAMQFEQWIQPQPTYSAVRFANGWVPRNRTHSLRSDSNSVVELEEDALYDTNLKANRVDYTDTFGFGSMVFINATHMTYENIPVTGNIGVDKFWIVRDRGNI